MRNIARIKAEVAAMPPKKATFFAYQKSMNKSGVRDMQLFGELCAANIAYRRRKEAKQTEIFSS